MPKITRALSSGDVLSYKNATALSRERSADQAVHESNESLLSVESGFTNFRGLINWGLILLLVFGGKMALQNLINNGILIDPYIWRYIVQGEHLQPAGLLFIASSNIFILIGFGLELVFQKLAFPNFLIVLLVGLNLVGSLIFPTAVILVHDWSPFFSAPLTMMYIIVFLKLWSYAQVNSWCRAARDCRQTEDRPPDVQVLMREDYAVLKKKRQDRASGRTVRAFSTQIDRADLETISEQKTSVDNVDDQDDCVMQFCRSIVKYPDNLNLRDLYYFMFAPTLCYELNFPQTFSIRKRFLLKRLIELLCLCHVIVMLVQQWMIPGLKSSVTPFIGSQYMYTLERLLTIAIPNHLIWLLGFYAMFHSFLNTLAELMKFADRNFYKDWWNSSSVTDFWSSWNIPVHRWCRRHIYKPLLIRGYSRFTASCIVFFVSAFFHEQMVSLPLKMPRMWAFLGMLGQHPYAILVHYYCPKGGKLGNMAMWLTLILGQPLALYMYFHDYYVLRYN